MDAAVEPARTRRQQVMAGKRGGAVVFHVLPGGGPWMILEHCPCAFHNVLRAAARGPKKTRCVCPRGLAMKQREIERRGELARLEQAGNGGVRASYSANRANVVSPPRGSGGLCETAEGMVIADRHLERGAGTKEHREMCEACPRKIKCGEYALAEELPGGAWRGMYGGMTWQERQKLGRAKEWAK